MSSDCIAIDIALIPDQKTVAIAKDLNAKLLNDYPDGFPLDDLHQPHITLMQAFIKPQDLDELGRRLAPIDIGAELEAKSLGFEDGGDLGVGGMEIDAAPWLLQAHADVAATVASFSLPNGDSTAFVRSRTEPDINPNTIDYVKSFSQAHAGDNYHPHLTLGMAHTDFLRRQQEGFEGFGFQVGSFDIYQLGNFGTCQRLLYRVQ